MGLFKRKPELEQLRARKDALEKQRLVAERELASAIAARQTALLEGDIDTPLDDQSNGLVGRLNDEKAAVLAAIVTIDGRISEAQSRHAAECEIAMRSAAGKGLSSAADSLDRVADEVASTLSKVPAVLDDVLNRMPLPHLVEKANLKVFSDAIVEALRAEVSEARRYTTRLAAGDVALISPRQEEIKPPPVPAIARLEILPLQKSKWLEADGSVSTTAAFTACSPPAPIAKRAIELGLAFDVLSNEAIALRMSMPQCWAHIPAEDCADLTQPKSAKPPGAPTTAAPAVHSEFIGQPRTGTATIRNSL
jgi:hypothetical protein